MEQNYDGAVDTGVRITFNVMGHPAEVGYFHMHKNGVDTVFIDHQCYHSVADNIYAGDRHAANFRNAMLCQAAIEAVWHVPCGEDRTPYGDSDLVYMANDWHTSLLPVYLTAYYQDHGKLPYARSRCLSSTTWRTRAAVPSTSSTPCSFPTTTRSISTSTTRSAASA